MKPAIGFLSILLACCPAVSQTTPLPRSARSILLVLPFDNASKAPGLEWIGDAIPEVLNQRLEPYAFVIDREDRLYAFDRLGIPSDVRLSRATLFRVAEEMDADYVVFGRYDYDGRAFSVRAQALDMKKLRAGTEVAQSGPLASIIDVQTALAWDLLRQIVPQLTVSREEFQAYSQPIRLDAFENYIRGTTATRRQDQVKLFREAIRLNPNYTQAQLALGKTYFAARDYTSAAEVLAAVDRAEPSAAEANFLLGLSAFYIGKYQQAQEGFEYVAQRLPLTEVSNNLGVVASRRGQANAVEYFRRAAEIEPRDPDYQFNLGVALYRSGDSDGAARALQQTLNLRSNDLEAKQLLERVSAVPIPAAQNRMPLERIKRNFDEASYRQVLFELEAVREARTAGGDPRAQAARAVERGRILMAETSWVQAEREFRDAILRDPLNAGAHSGLAKALLTRGDAKTARSEARAAIRLRPSAEAYLVLAQLDLQENNLEAAGAEVDHALALEPGSAEALALRQAISSRLSQRTSGE